MRTDLHASGDTVVLNTLGELDAVFPLADVVVMGRSFGQRHGSDPMGPASAGKPTLIGPNHGDLVSKPFRGVIVGCAVFPSKTSCFYLRPLFSM